MQVSLVFSKSNLVGLHLFSLVYTIDTDKLAKYNWLTSNREESNKSFAPNIG